MPCYLHLGSGRDSFSHDLFAGYEEIRVDIDASVNPDIVADASKLPMEDESVDGVLSSHMLEHLHPFDAARCLAESYRVLKPDGLAVAIVPNFEHACQQVARGGAEESVYYSMAGHITPLDMIYGFVATTKNPYMVHKNGFTRRTLVSAFEEAGFEDVALKVWDELYNLEAVGRKVVA